MTGMYLASRVRQILNEIDVSKISDAQIWEIATEVQDNILQRVRPESRITINLQTNQNKYYFDKSKVLISSILPSWDGNITLVAAGTWKDVINSTSCSVSLPSQATIYDKHIYFAPMPSTSSMPTSQSIEFWVHRIASCDPIDSNNDSIVPHELDRALIYGTCAEFNAQQYLPLYEKELNDNSMLPFLKSNLTITTCTW